MKKILIFAVLTAVALPAWAEDGAKDIVAVADEVVATNTVAAADYIAESEPTAESNPKIKFPRGMQIGVGASVTSGLNGFVGYANKNFESFWWKRLGVRFDFASTSPIKSSINSAIDSALNDGADIGDGLTIGGGALKAQHIGALVDFYPFGNTWFLGGWRLTGGYVAGRMKLDAMLTGTVEGAPSDPFEFEINGQEYKYTGNSIDATAGLDWKYSGPYLGTGFDLGLFWGIKIFMDAGVVFTSKTASLGMDVPDAGLLQWNSTGNTWDPVNTSDLNDNIDFATADANDALSDIKFYPMVKMGFMYRF
ncbi:MAG: hypothetical protein LBJ73_03750 [Rickettsiales bacterium]|jgi:hypothetical protein|nr:hypothetical protein [Rickettsiales bacterium]